MAFVQEGLAPFNEFVVDLLDDLRPEGVVAPMRQREPPAQCRLVAFHDEVNPFAEIGECPLGRQTRRDDVDHGLRGIVQLIIQRLRCAAHRVRL